ncbi:DUF3159 domain-containing protein [Streptomyces sp. 2A115]|uniref:DUF3159 domain-containing protein n=1 Tax=Streptomyces sp. 2A115 TaxID=3457439 RepID=UPI003FD061AE
MAITVLRLVRKEPLQPALSGLFGFAVAAFVAYKTGLAKALRRGPHWPARGRQDRGGLSAARPGPPRNAAGCTPLPQATGGAPWPAA